MEACPHCTSLMQMCIEELIFSSDILKKSIYYLPVKIHTLLFTEAALMLPRFGMGVKETILALVSAWPKEKFCIKELLPEKHLHNVLHAGNHPSLMSVIIEGLLSIESHCKLSSVDFTGAYTPSAFLGEEDENLYDTIKWRMTDLFDRCIPSKVKVQNPIDVFAECQLNLSDFLAVDKELLGLSVHQNSSFRMNIVKITVDNYHHRQINHFKGFFKIIKTDVLEKLVIYGKRRGINLVLWDMADEFEQLDQLKAFGLGTSGPKFHLPNPDEPCMEEIFNRASVSLRNWTQLNEIYFIGIVLTNQVSKLLGALTSALKKLILYGCCLHKDDLVHLSSSHHVPHLEELGLEYNDLHNLGSIICDIAERADSISILNLKETKMMLHEKVLLLETLQSSQTLHTLVLHEKEDMLSTEGYETLVEIACCIDNLTEFYIFPFDYKPFEMFYREVVEEACQEILFINERTNLSLYY